MFKSQPRKLVLLACVAASLAAAIGDLGGLPATATPGAQSCSRAGYTDLGQSGATLTLNFSSCYNGAQVVSFSASANYTPPKNGSIGTKPTAGVTRSKDGKQVTATTSMSYSYSTCGGGCTRVGQLQISAVAQADGHTTFFSSQGS